MKALIFTLSMIVTISASTSNAFCMKKYMASLGINSNKGNFATQMSYNDVKSAPLANDGKSVFRRK